MQIKSITTNKHSKRDATASLFLYPASFTGILLSIFSINIPYPTQGSFIITCVTIFSFASSQVYFPNVALCKLAVPENGAAAHECGQVGTTHFYRLCTVSTLFVKKIALLLRFINVFCASS